MIGFWFASSPGFARAQGSDDRRLWVWEARSVNGRNLEIRCRVPQGFDRLENPARAAIGGRMKRGNVSLTSWAYRFLNAAERAGEPVDKKLKDRLANILRLALRSDASTRP